MDASASPKVDRDFNVCGFFLKIENATFPSTLRPNNTVIKYTKLPDFDFDSRVSWPKDSYTLPPRLRRIISLDQDLHTSRSLQNDFRLPHKIMSSSFTKRKIVTITEDDEVDLHPKFPQEEKILPASYSSNKGASTNLQNKEPSRRITSQLVSSKYTRNTKPTSKTSNLNSNQDVNSSRTSYNSKYSNVSIQTTHVNAKCRNNNIVKEKEILRNDGNKNSHQKLKINKSFNSPHCKENDVAVNKSNFKSNTVSKKSTVNPKPNRTSQQHKSKVTILKEIKARTRPVSTIHVPLDEKRRSRSVVQTDIKHLMRPIEKELRNVEPDAFDCGIEVNIKCSKDMNVGTDLPPDKADKFTYVDKVILQDKIDVPMNLLQRFDSLDIPNVTLTKDKSDIPKEDLVNFSSQSLPNLQIPALKMTPHKSETNCVEKGLISSASYIIGSATMTCTTKKKINFHVVGKNEHSVPDLASSLLTYPMNVISVFKKETKQKELSDLTTVDNMRKGKSQSNAEKSNYLNEMQSLNCSYVIDRAKLVKPSDVISSLQNDFICEQFQKELDFIDSFIESLQYLESCSLSSKDLLNNKVENWVSNSGYDVKTPEYNSFFSKFKNGADNDNTETMASKSLCLLNLLIRDEQRRAKNLLFVLKMREDALKDFTKSHILWLENKKKQDNTDISTLKKKQRGALLKLQHECGEMQRMRKALLALSEKRKIALMKAKKNIEVKLTNVNVDHIVLGKKKIKRTTPDRNIAPLKCFDLSSSGCDDTNVSRAKSDSVLAIPQIATSFRSAEKCIQTTGNLHVDQTTDTAAENFVTVDGSYLNILFRNLSLPHIFSSGKEYEVNEEALKNIVNTTNSQSHLNESDLVEKFMDQIKNCDLDKSSTPSTARSLVEELDQYYKGLAEEEKSLIDLASRDIRNSLDSEDERLLNESKLAQYDTRSHKSTSTMTSDSNNDSTLYKAANLFVDQLCMYENSVVTVETQSHRGKDFVSTCTQAGPLPVPPGAAAVVDLLAVTVPTVNKSALDESITLTPKSSASSAPESSASSEPLCPSVSSVSSLTLPVQCEAEELRRQQLAIEREIKALEQQQSQLLVVREIPDKPPPPYTPPIESRTHKPPRVFAVDDTIEEKIHKNITTPTPTSSDEPSDSVDIFVNEFCLETMEKQKLEQSDKPWDACNLLPQKPPIDLEKLVKKATAELKEILSAVPPTAVTGVGSRRSDHIDDILFAEWRRCEYEWTALHTDETIVKTQMFESIFQKILTETIDEYKKTVPVEINELSE